MPIRVALSNRLKQLLIGFTLCLNINSGSASDFSQAQQTYVPPSLISRYDAAPLGEGNTAIGSIDPSLGFLSSFDLSQTGSGTSDLSNLTGSDVIHSLSQVSNLPGLSNVKTSIEKFLQQGNLGKAETLASKYFKDIPTPMINQLSSAATAAAQKYLQNHDLGAAGDQIRQALALDPSNKTSQSVYGQILKAQGFNTNSADDHIKLGDNLISQGKYNQASIEYNNALVISPSAEAYVGLGNIAFSLNRAEQARNEYERALSVNPDSGLAFRQRGLLKYALQDQVGASADLTRALSLLSHDRIAGEALLELWRRQVAANPGEVNGHLGLARAYLITGDLDSARAEYQEVARLDPNNPYLPAARASFKLALARREANNCFQAAKTLEHEGAISDAHKKITEAISYYPHDVAMLLCQGKLSEKLGLYDQAHQAYMDVLKEDPKNIQAAGRLKKLPAHVSESVSAQVAKPSDSSNSAPLPAPSNLLSPETPNLAPVNKTPTKEVPLPPQAFMPSTLMENSAMNANANMIGSNPSLDSLSNFICSVRDLAISKQLQLKEIDRLNKQALKTAQTQVFQETNQNKDYTSTLITSPDALASVASCAAAPDPYLGF